MPRHTFDRRAFLQAAALGLAGAGLPAAPAKDQILRNGIRLPSPWPPRRAYSLDPMPVPYLGRPPAVIPIDVGRQLFVDDFLIARTNLFYLTNGELYAFWVSPEETGASHGYVAAGGPGLTGPTDTVGSGAPAR